MDNPFQHICEQLQRIEKQLDSITQQPANVVLPDRIGRDEAKMILGISDSKIYKLTSTNKIPHGTFCGRLVFSRRELMTWLETNIKRPNPEKQIAQKLAISANRKQY
jgi:excisionase family DNA binding protein